VLSKRCLLGSGNADALGRIPHAFSGAEREDAAMASVMGARAAAVRRKRRALALLVSMMLVMPTVGVVRRLGGDSSAHPFSWQMYSTTSDQEDEP
jgi:hypothetical protein